MKEHGQTRTTAMRLALAGIFLAGGGMAGSTRVQADAPMPAPVRAASGQGSGRWAVEPRRARYAERTLTFHTADWPDQTIHFTTANPSHHPQSLEVTLAEGAVELSGDGTCRQGHHGCHARYHRTLQASHTHAYTLDDISRDGSSPIQWRLTWDARHDPKVLTVTLEQGEAIALVRAHTPDTLRMRGAAPRLLTAAGPMTIESHVHEPDSYRRRSPLPVDPTFPEE